MKKFIFSLFFILPILANAQIVRVYHLNTKELLFNVVVIKNTGANIQPNTKGEFELDLSNTSEKFIFKSIGFEPTTISSKSIVLQNNKVYLSVVESLEEVVISNTKWKQPKRQISKKISSIRKNDIHKTNPQTTADAIAKTASVFVQKSQQGGGSPIIRGFSTNRLLISVDGVRMNNAIFRSGNLQNIISIDPLSLESAEIILGPGSVIYGSDAIGGTLNFKTLSPEIKSEANKTVSGNLFYRTSTANSEKTAHADVNLAFKKIASVSSFSFSSFDDLIQGSNGPDDFLRTNFVVTNNGVDSVVANKNPKKQVSSGYSQYNFLQKITYQPNKKWGFDAQIIYTTTSDFDRYDRLQRKRNGQFRSAEWFYGPQRWFMGLQTISYNKKSLLTDGIKLSSSYQYFEESRNTRNFNSSIRNNNTEKLDVYTLNLDARKIFHHIKINYGGEFAANRIHSDASTTNINTQERLLNIATRYPDNSYWRSLGIYTAMNWELSQSLNISAGIRFNQVQLNANFKEPELEFPFDDASLNVQAFTWSLGNTYQLNSTISFKGNINTAFRAPNIDDIGKIFSDSEPGSITVPNPNLKPELAHNFSFSALYKKNKYKFSLTAYNTFLKDALTKDNFNFNGQESILFRGEESTVFAIQNSNRSRIYGFEFSGEIPIAKNLTINALYSLTKGEEILSSGFKTNVRHVPPGFGNIHLKYTLSKWEVDLFSDFNQGFRFNELAPSEQLKVDIYARDKNGNPFLPSWYTLNIRGSYTINNHIKFTTALENITDQRYRPFSSGISAPGINFVAAANYTF